MSGRNKCEDETPLKLIDGLVVFSRYTFIKYKTKTIHKF